MILGSTSDYLEVLNNLLKASQRQFAASLGLQMVHLQIVRYLARCNRYSDSLLVLSDFLGQTKGSVSVSVALLEKKSLLEKCPDPHDKRKQHLRLTPAGEALAEQEQALSGLNHGLLSKTEQHSVNASLNTLLRKLQQANDYQVFGICSSCAHLQKGEEGEVRCGLTGETLSQTDQTKICVHHLTE